jgi:erythromycin esterase
VRITALFLALSLLTVPAHATRRRAVAPPAPLPVDAWLARNAVPFDTTEARTPLDDLRPLRAMIGDARVVLLGEATHGSREFFTIKHRIVELLVREHGFTVFGIEASMPDADLINGYVLHGEGDPGHLLHIIGMWPWDTEEVLDLIRWMREYNLSRGDKPPVQFRGFDMQRSDTAMKVIASYLGRVDAPNAEAIRAHYSCFAAYGLFGFTYRNLSVEERDACAAKIATARELLIENRAAYVARSSVAEYELVLQYARIVEQHEGQVGGRAPGRDPWMAENATWLANVAYPGEKIVLWAHNHHVTVEANGRMGTEMRKTFDAREMVTVGFVFDRGDFWAFGDPLQPNRVNRVDAWPEALYEPLFRATGHSRFFVDLRNPASADAWRVFNTTSSIWRVGGRVADPSNVAALRETTTLAHAFDIVIWIETVTPTRLR